VDFTVNFLLRFAQMLGPSAIRNAKTAAVLHRGGKIFGEYFYSAQGVKPSLPSTWTFV